jgi:NAD(P)-dependent dehydrogenase (short-subunit alcohol dehydrogenase family)
VKTAIVTGAGEGIGAEIAEHLCAAGYRVGVLDVRADIASATAVRLGNAQALTADVSDADGVAAAFAEFGEVPDLLVNNAGIVRFGPLEEQSPQDYADVIKVNLLGACLCARQVAPGMIARGSGSIVNITSINGGTHPAPGSGLYCGTKAAMRSMTEAMSLEWGPKGVRVNAVAPGFIAAGMSASIHANPRAREVRGGGVPLRRWGTAADIANAVLFLASEAAAYVNGQQLVVDGGVSNSVMAQLPRD